MTELNQTDLRVLTTGNKRAWDTFVVAAAPVINAVVRRAMAAYRLGEDDVMDAVIPGRCAAPPAPAMMIFSPRSLADCA